MFTLLTIALWIGGLAIMLAGHFPAGAMLAATGAITAPKALSRPNDMETAFGLALAFVGVVTIIRVAAAVLRVVA